LEAKEDLQGIWDYLSQYSVTAADRIVETIAAAYLSLLDNPLRGRSREELLPGLRSLVVEKYLVFYQIEGEVIIVARIIHGARDLEAIFRQPAEDEP
jgi:toxin ParE1/3/4